MNPIYELIAKMFFLLAWGIAGLAVAHLAYRLAKKADRKDDDDDDSGGGESGDDPYHIDPDDPQDWWKKERK